MCLSIGVCVFFLYLLTFIDGSVLVSYTFCYEFESRSRFIHHVYFLTFIYCDCVLISYTFLCLYSCHGFKCDWNLILLFVFVKLNKNPLEIRMLCELNGLIIFTLNIFIDVIMMINRREQYNRLLWQSWP